MEIFSRYNVCSTLVTLSHRREQRKQRRASIDTEVGTDYAFKHYPNHIGMNYLMPRSLPLQMNNLMSFELGLVTSQTPFPAKVHA